MGRDPLARPPVGNHRLAMFPDRPPLVLPRSLLLLLIYYFSYNMRAIAINSAPSSFTYLFTIVFF